MCVERLGVEGRLDRGGAPSDQRERGRGVAVAVRGTEVDAGHTVDLQVDQSRYGDRAPHARPHPDRRDAAVVDLDVARHEHAVDECGGHTQAHQCFPDPSPTGTPPSAAER